MSGAAAADGPRLEIQEPGAPARIVPVPGDGPVSIGRAAGSDVQLACTLASRRHARLVRRDGTWWLEDLGSHNGTRLGGVRVTDPVRLRSGDVVEIGRCRLRWREPGGSPGAPAPAPPTLETVSVHAARSTHDLLVVPAAEAAEAAARPDDRTRLLARIGRLAASLLPGIEPEALPRRIADVLRAELDAGRAALLVPAAGDPGFSVEALSADRDGDRAFLLSGTVARRCLEGGEAVLIRDAQQDPSLDAQQSIVSGGIRTAVCAPVRDEDGVHGLLYADRRVPALDFDDDDLATVALLGHLAGMKMREAHARQEAERRRRLEDEARNAARVQRMFLPTDVLERGAIRLAAVNVPSFEVGGDWYGRFAAADGRVVFGLGDVSGKGMPAALLTTVLHARVHAGVEAGHGLVDIARRLNDALCSEVAGQRVITLFLASVDPATGRLEFVNAGHEPPLLVAPDGSVEGLRTGDLLLGVLAGEVPTLGEAVVPPGGRLVVVSDGVTEAEDPAEDPFGPERLVELVRAVRDRPAEAIVDAVVEAVSAHALPADPADDVTVLVLEAGKTAPR